MTDHWPGSLLGSAGHQAVQTPTLDQLALTGTRFARAYSECPVCVPARRTLMTGVTPRTHGDRTMRSPTAPMPDAPTLAQCFRDAGYQASAVGKLHVFPQRARIGFDDVVLNEEGRTQWGVTDDYEQFLIDNGHAGEHFAHGLSNNQYVWRPWHLAERYHPTTWATQQMCRTIKRRDPTRPGFWYLSHMYPHPPLAPLTDYLRLYEHVQIDDPMHGNWVGPDETLPYVLQASIAGRRPIGLDEAGIRMVRRAFYALCTHIDHQLRTVIGTLREEGILDDTVILFGADHGDMLGDHGLWAKTLFYEGSANIPMILSTPQGYDGSQQEMVDNRLVGLQDVMPTLLELAGIPVPESVDGRSMIDSDERSYLYGEHGEGVGAARMVHDGHYKLIYYPTGNRVQLFDLNEDPHELDDLAEDDASVGVRDRLLGHLTDELYGDDCEWLRDGRLVGLPNRPYKGRADRGLANQRGLH